jgi:class 3 adenylate cyclase
MYPRTFIHSSSIIMGNNGSSPPRIEDISTEELSTFIASLGDRYTTYAEAIQANGVDGELLSTMTEDEFQETLDDLGVSSRLHRRKSLQLFRKSLGASGGYPPGTITVTEYSGSRSSSSGSSRSSVGSWDRRTRPSEDDDDAILLPGKGPLREVLHSEIEHRIQDYPMPDELHATGQIRDSHAPPIYSTGLASVDEQRHLAPDFYKTIDSIPGAHRPPIAPNDMERVAQVCAYGLQDITPDSDIAQTLTGYVEMATELFGFDYGDISFLDHEHQFTFARVGLTPQLQEAIIGKLYTPLTYGGTDNSEAFLCQADRGPALCNYPTLTKRTFVVHDLHADATFQWLKGIWPFGAYAGSPLVTPSGLVLGTLCLHHLQPRPDFGKAQEVQLEQVAKMIARALEHWSIRKNNHNNNYLEPTRLEISKEVFTTNTRRDSQTSVMGVDTMTMMRMPPQEKAALVLTDVQGSTELWEADPMAMKKALELHDAIIRKLCAQHRGYEVDTEGDSFLLAFHDAVDAFGFSLTLQEELNTAPWSSDILALPAAAAVAVEGNHPHHHDHPPHYYFRGLRVRIGVHMGPVTVGQNSVTARTEYSGLALDLTRAVEGMAHGGQILTTLETWNVASILAESKLNGHQVMDLGMHVVQQGRSPSDGVTSKRILQLVPTTLAVNYSELKHSDTARDSAGRQFPPIKTLKQLSKGFADAPGGGKDHTEVTIAFIGTSEIEKRYKEPAASVAQVIGHASSLLHGITEGYQCQNNMLAFPNRTEAVKFGLSLMDLLREQKPMDDGASLAQLITFGCVHDQFVALEPHKTTGRADYFGRVVNRAARVAFVSKLGTVCVGMTSAEVSAKKVFPVSDSTVNVKLVAMRQLKGVDEEMAIFECTRKVSGRSSFLSWFDAVIHRRA